MKNVQLEALQEFLCPRLPRKAKRRLPGILKDVRAAAERYDRLAEHRKEWKKEEKYGERRKRLQAVRGNVQKMEQGLSKLDLVSRDSLELSLGVKRFAAMLGSALILISELDKLIDMIPLQGRPRDIAKERWIQDVAVIYGLAFGKEPSIWESASFWESEGKSRKAKSEFLSLLELASPDSLLREGTSGKLSSRQVVRALKRGRGERP